MLSNKVADVLSERFWKLSEGTPAAVASLSSEEVRAIGTSSAKAKYIISLAKEFLSFPNLPDQLISMPDEEVIARLTKIPGIGSWSAKMYLIFVLDRQDVLPYEDGAFNQAFEAVFGIIDSSKSKRRVREYCKIWKPYSSIAARYLYRYLDMGFTVKK